jgi:hypothetical protein
VNKWAREKGIPADSKRQPQGSAGNGKKRKCAEKSAEKDI